MRGQVGREGRGIGGGFFLASRTSDLSFSRSEFYADHFSLARKNLKMLRSPARPSIRGAKSEKSLFEIWTPFWREALRLTEICCRRRKFFPPQNSIANPNLFGSSSESKISSLWAGRN